MSAVTLRVDGASRGNPGPAGIGAVLEFGDGREPVEMCAYIGETTNNVAEYRALLLAPVAVVFGGRESRGPR